ncbi:uncharacterized protein LOC124197750 [Daphnia pulex]|uniref:uncharacterized protein LOC124197750 n=1 Tax=Daphnia pulex TaxID=6669 RepID=UPI001EDFF6DF|nr:uncharacterized protein LOC124197750 [Daphnia pulex]XP_046449244.1 uncharacterized protein LOC124197750 [Daphnia pulex]
MAVTYRAVERYSARRLPSASLPSSSNGDISSSSSTRLKQANQIICRAASFYFSRFQKSILRSDLSLIGALRTWLTNLAFAAYVTFYSLPYHLLSEVLKWTVRWLLTTYYYYRRPGILCVTFDDDFNRNRTTTAHSSCWAFSVYLVDSGGASPAQLRQSIADGAEDRPALKLVRKAEAFGWIHLWKHPEAGERTLDRMSSVQELPPVWKHQLVTEDTVHEYISEVYRRPEGADGEQPPWRVYLIPLALSHDPDKVSWPASGSNCCLLVRCHRLLSLPLDSLIREALNKPSIERDNCTPSSMAVQQRVVVVAKSFDSLQRAAIATGNGWGAHVSWTRPIPSIGFIDRICDLTGATSGQVVLTAFCQSVNQCCRQSATAAAAVGVLHVELTSSSSSLAGSFPNADDYTLPLGSAALDDGQVVLETLRRQRKNRKNPYRILPKDTLFRGLADSPSAILSVKMEMLASSSSLPGSFLHWSSSPTPLIPIRLCLWADDSSIRLGLIQHHQLLFPVRADDIERRIHQLAAGLGVQNRRPLSRHSSPSSSPQQRLTPPPTPRL